jgi:hypothetical protein
MKSRGYATYVCLAGGLGNQLFQLSAGLYVSGNNPLILLTDLSPTRQHIPGIPDLAGYELPDNVSFQAVARPLIASTIGTRSANVILRISSASSGIFTNKPTISLARKAATPILRATLAEQVAVFAADGVSYDPNLTSAERNQLLIGYFQTWRYVSKPSIAAIMKKISLRQPSLWLDELKILSQRENPLVVHIRLADYRHNPEIGMVTPAYIRNAIQYQRSKGNTGQLWLFSDEPEEAMKYLPSSERNGNLFLVTPPEDNTHPAAILEAMRLGKAHIISNSSFGWWAAWLSNSALDNTVSPQPWFREELDADTIRHPQWKPIHLD